MAARASRSTQQAPELTLATLPLPTLLPRPRAAATLTLSAANQITFNTNANLTSTIGALDIALNSGAGGITNLRNINTNRGGNAIADGSAVTLANTAGVSLTLNGISETLGSLAGGGTTGGWVALGSGTLITGGNNTTTTYSGIISGAPGAPGGTDGALTKVGTGVMTLSGANTYAGPTIVGAGTLTLGPQIDCSIARHQPRHAGGIQSGTTCVGLCVPRLDSARHWTSDVSDPRQEPEELRP
jgi:autotransporter-associated beta strand protein